MKSYRFLLITFALLLYGTTYGNNLKIDNVTATTNSVTFDISWENSWYVDNEPNNWDGVWVFIKGQDCASQFKRWDHIDVSTNSGDHSAAAPLTVDAVTDGKGVFVRRAAVGSGNISTTSVTIKLQGTYNLSNVSFQVMGIEMVAVLEGGFQVGEASPTVHSFKTTTISSENMIAQNTLYNGVTDNSKNPTIPAAFPKGYSKFYLMKHEISQDQYAQFLNLLDYSKQVLRTQNTPASAVQTNALSDNNTSVHNRSSVKIKTPGSVATPAVYGCDLNNDATFDGLADGQNIACNYLQWEDLLAYLDWAALRPITELEYEKACRGLSPAIYGEFAWGNGNIAEAKSNALNNTGTESETSTANPAIGIGLAATDAADDSYGPLRVGFAAKSNTGRIGSGASYWGALDMTGNVWEQTVSAGYNNSNISPFTGVLGDGETDAFGDANQTGWDLDAKYSVVKGGSWMTGNSGLPTSSFCTTFDYSSRSTSYYIRNFTLNNLNNNSSYSATGYTDYTSSVASATLVPGQSYVPELSTGYNGTNYQNIAVWIDYDDDGTFSPSEKVTSTGNSYIYTNMYSGYSLPAFTVLNTPGVHRMRVMYQYGSSSSNYGDNMVECTRNSNNSEVEDYLVEVGSIDNESSVGARSNIDNTTYNLTRHSETGGRGGRQF